MTTLERIYNKFPKETDAIRFLEEALWDNVPICPHCKTSFFSIIEKGMRYRCNKCNTNFSITAKTLFHRSKVDLRKWLYCLVLPPQERKSLRQMADELNVTKDTVSKMIKKIEDGYILHQKTIITIQNLLI